MSLIWFQNLKNQACFALMNSLQNPDTFTNFEELLHILSFILYKDWNFVLGQNRSKSSVDIDVLNSTLTTLELSREDFASVTNLDSKLAVVSNRFEKSSVRQQVPLILI